MEQKKFRLLVKIASVATACVVFALAIIAVVQFFEIGAANRRVGNLRQQLAYVTEEKYNLETAISDQKNAENAEKFAREQLGWIKDGEIVYEE